MKICIHRGAHEIGGSYVEVENDSGERLVLDVGSPLVALEGEELTVPNVAGPVEIDPALQGIVISHAHQDHWGLVDQTLPSVPLYMGQGPELLRSQSGHDHLEVGLSASPCPWCRTGSGWSA
jgi:ribonuclease J